MNPAHLSGLQLFPSLLPHLTVQLIASHCVFEWVRKWADQHLATITTDIKQHPWLLTSNSIASLLRIDDLK